MIMTRKIVARPVSKRNLGSTGLTVSLLAVGGHAIGKPADPRTGIRIIRTAIDNGINFLDNAWDYHGGRSEEIMGKALQDGYREKVILMTKNHGRDYDTYKKQLKESLLRLQTDYIDVLQFHEIIHEGEPDKIFDEGAIDAAVEDSTRIGEEEYRSNWDEKSRWGRYLEDGVFETRGVHSLQFVAGHSHSCVRHGLHGSPKEEPNDCFQILSDD